MKWQIVYICRKLFLAVNICFKLCTWSGYSCWGCKQRKHTSIITMNIWNDTKTSVTVALTYNCWNKLSRKFHSYLAVYPPCIKIITLNMWFFSSFYHYFIFCSQFIQKISKVRHKVAFICFPFVCFFNAYCYVAHWFVNLYHWFDWPMACRITKRKFKKSLGFRGRVFVGFFAPKWGTGSSTNPDD